MSRITTYFGASPPVPARSPMVLATLQAGPPVSGASRSLFGPFVIQCGYPSLVLVWYSILSAIVWAVVMWLRGGEGLRACPP